jgi:hypothetical protein
MAIPHDGPRDGRSIISDMRPGYPAARSVAARVHPHFARHLAAKKSEEVRTVAFLPGIEDIEAIIDVAFWASLRREETCTPRISLAFVSPAQLEVPLIFERPVPFASTALTRIGPAVERPGIHLCVWRQHSDDMVVWGATRDLPESCFVLEVVSPGLLLIKRSRGNDSSKFVNVAVLQGDEIKIIDQNVATTPDCPELLSSLLGFQSEDVSSGSINVLIQLAVSMREHGRGGSLLVVPSGADLWKESILQPIAYSLSPSFCALVDLMRENPGERSRRRWQEALRRVIDGVAGLTAVDGATIITDQYELLAFGAKIVRRAGWAQVGDVLVSEPIEGMAAVIAEPGQLGGTRHLSAAQFVHDQRDSIAMVASQDGRFTVFGWSSCEQIVYANRIEALLF